jgi:hypothetical protein
MREIQLTQGKVAIVDDADFEFLSQWKWYAGRYAMRIAKVNGRKTTILMHRIILGLGSGVECDHINRNKFDNRRENLRACKHEENLRNRPKMGRVRTSKYVGVCKSGTRSWKAKICFKGEHHYLGNRFSTEESAARAYDEAAKRLHGEFASLNF